MALPSPWNTGGGASSGPFSQAPRTRAPVFGVQPRPSATAPAPRASSLNAGPPDRIDVNSIFTGATGVGMQALGVLGQAPGFAYERPLAIADTLARKAGLGSPVSNIEQAIGSIPIVGPILGAIGDIPARAANFLPAAQNAQSVSLLASIPASTPDSALLKDVGLGGVSQRDFLAEILGNNKTVGQFRAEMQARGFTAAEVAGVAAGTRSGFDFGDHPISDNPLSDIAFRLAFDPTNVAIGLGLFGKAARGVGMLTKMVDAGVELRKPLQVAEAAQAVAAGSAREATWAGVATYMGQIGRGYRNLAIGSTGVQLGIQAVSAIAPKGINTPASGFLEGLNEVNKAAIDNRPLSTNMIFSIWSAFHFPLHDMLNTVKATAGAAKYAVVMSEIEPKVIEALAPKGMSYTAARTYVYDRIGGRDSLHEAIGHWAGSIANKAILRNENLVAGLNHADSFDEAVLSQGTLHTVVTDWLTNAFAKNTLRGRDVVAGLKDWHAFRPDPAGQGEMLNKIAFQWDGELAMERWISYRAGAAALSAVYKGRLSDLVGKLGNDPLPTIGVSGVISTHDLNAMQESLRIASDHGYVEAKAIERMLSRAPQLMKLDTTGFWERNLLPGAGPVKLTTVINKLGQLKADASTLRDLTHEAAAAESAASHGIPSAEGPVGPRDWSNADTGIVLNTSRWNAEAWGVRSTIGDAAAARSDPAVQAIEHNAAQSLNDSGWQVEQSNQTIETYLGTHEPGFDLVMGPGDLQDFRLAGTLIGSAGDQSAVLLTIQEAEARAMGLNPAGLEARWYLPGAHPDDLEQVAKVMTQHFDGWTLNDGAGVVKVGMAPDWIAGLKGLTFQERVDAINARLSEIFPGDVVGDRGITHTVKPAYVESIGKEAGNHVTYSKVLAAAKSDPRVSAFAGESRRLVASPAAERAAAGSRAAGAAAAGGGGGGPVVPVNASPFEQVGHGAAAQAVTEPGYLYHTTDPLAAQKIAEGALLPVGPAYRGEQLARPWSGIGDTPGSRRSYWNRDATTMGQFQTESNSAILRIKAADAPGRVRNEPGVGDTYLSRQVPAKDIQVLGGDGQWHPLRGFYDTPGGNVPPHMQAAADLVAPAYTEAPAAHPTPPLTQAIRADLDASQVAAGAGPGVSSDYIKGQVLFNAQRDAQVSAMLDIVPFENGGINAASDLYKDALYPVEQYLHELGPEYTIKPLPKGGLLYDPSVTTPVIGALRQREGFAAWLYHAGPLAPATRFVEWMTQPVHGSQLAQDARQAAYAELVPLGAKPGEIDAWYHAMSVKAQEATVGSMKIPMFRGPAGLGANTQNAIAQTIFSAKTIEAVGADKFHLVYDRSVNRFIRSIDDKARAGTANRLQLAIDQGFRGYQNTIVGDTTRYASKTFYHLFRFITDPRWHAMNLLEADVLGGMRYGLSATRFAAGDLRKAPISAAAAAHGGVGAVAERADTGWLNSHNLSGYISRGNDVERPYTVLTTLRGMDDAGYTAIRKFFPGARTDADIVTELDNFLYSYDTKGVGQTITENLHHWGTAQDLREMTWMAKRDIPEAGIAKGQVLTEAHITALDRQIPNWRFDGSVQGRGAAAMIQRIWDANQTTYESVVRVFEGNGSRSTIERLMNSYWLYWPLSYQLKAGKWLLDVLTHRAGGQTTNLAGAATLSQLIQLHEQRAATDPAYAGIFSQNPTFWMIAQMMLPITPDSLGVSLSRPIRYAGSSLKAHTGGATGPFGFLGDYAAARDPLSMATASLNLGLPYSLDLATRFYGETVSSSQADKPPPPFIPPSLTSEQVRNLQFGGTP